MYRCVYVCKKYELKNTISFPLKKKVSDLEEFITYCYIYVAFLGFTYYEKRMTGEWVWGATIYDHINACRYAMVQSSS